MGDKGNRVRCPMCNRFGSKELQGYCKQCYPLKPKEKPIELCSKCGLQPATRVNDEYNGCVPYPLCDECYIDKFGYILETDWPDGNAPQCIQCNQPAYKIAPNNQPYCLRHYRDQVEPPVNPMRKHFKEDFDLNDKLFWDDKFKIVKDDFDMEGKWR